MPLPAPYPREILHSRAIQMDGYLRADGLVDIDLHMTDRKPDEVVFADGRCLAAGDLLHDMALRLVVDQNLRIVDAIACIDASPYRVCPEATEVVRDVIGFTIGPGWSAMLKERFHGRKGCTHLTELLRPVATVAIQSLWRLRKGRAEPTDSGGRPQKIDSCYAYAASREVVKMRWPAHFREDDTD
ncbi:DUF2889 domain-containing protein [Advenella mimigardefordensis]|uniref:DUF2889 domain-containing protein n=1 Tax=Advenella mimigardefordensis (strain DSM 17166 / LMG 22922 / DPN7) TaxID=1247726 RepID=W0PDD6_ADVMD|nr:DUF2889 domain-containing protein [Advenella mimigardefordensis]AHG63477.1 hypothetical protein MIM_c13850 [Advenella mimigardefordensis DPN7]